MRLNLDIQPLGLDNKEIPGPSLGRLVASVFSQATKGDAIKLFDWARTLYHARELELDNSDTELFKNLINESEMITNLTKAQVLQIIIDTKEESKKNKESIENRKKEV